MKMNVKYMTQSMLIHMELDLRVSACALVSVPLYMDCTLGPFSNDSQVGDTLVGDVCVQEGGAKGMYYSA